MSNEDVVIGILTEIRDTLNHLNYRLSQGIDVRVHDSQGMKISVDNGVLPVGLWSSDGEPVLATNGVLHVGTP